MILSNHQKQEFPSKNGTTLAEKKPHYQLLSRGIRSLSLVRISPFSKGSTEVRFKPNTTQLFCEDLILLQKALAGVTITQEAPEAV